MKCQSLASSSEAAFSLTFLLFLLFFSFFSFLFGFAGAAQSGSERGAASTCRCCRCGMTSSARRGAVRSICDRSRASGSASSATAASFFFLSFFFLRGEGPASRRRLQAGREARADGHARPCDNDRRYYWTPPRRLPSSSLSSGSESST